MAENLEIGQACGLQQISRGLDPNAPNELNGGDAAGSGKEEERAV